MRQCWRVALILLSAKTPLSIGEITEIYNAGLPLSEKRSCPHVSGLARHLRNLGLVENHGRRGSRQYVPSERLLDAFLNEIGYNEIRSLVHDDVKVSEVIP